MSLQSAASGSRETTSQMIASIMMGNSGVVQTSSTTTTTVQPPAVAAAAAAAAPITGGAQLAVQALQKAQDEALTRQSQQTVLVQRESIRPNQSKDQQEPRVLEYFQYAKHAHGNYDVHWASLSFSKVFRFMWHQCMRENKGKGATKEARQKRKDGIFFYVTNHNKTMKDYKEAVSSVSDLKQMKQPTKPCGTPTFDACKAVFRKTYKAQNAQGVDIPRWDKIWLSDTFDDLYEFVKERQPIAKKSAYEEKLDGEFAPCAICDSYADIEKEYWRDSDNKSKRTMSKALRHRYICLMTSSGVLRTESLYRGELSDHLGFFTPKLDTDVHPIFLIIGQIARGKTTHGRKQCLRSTRHLIVELCSIGGFSFCLGHRFYHAEEFHRFTTADWKNNKKWYDVKVLVDITSNNPSAPMSNNSYAKHMKKILDRLLLSCNKILHLGRNMGAKVLEMLEAEKEEILDMGQWSKGTCNKSYSSKLPMGAIRKLAGFHGSNAHFYFCPRSVVKPSDELRRLTPFGEWCIDASKDLEAACVQGECLTARMFLRLMVELNDVFLQDAAAMMIGGRHKTQFFKAIPVFSAKEFLVSYFRLYCYRRPSAATRPSAAMRRVPAAEQQHLTKEQSKSSSKRKRRIL